jgi:hypothetical protein
VITPIAQTEYLDNTDDICGQTTKLPSAELLGIVGIKVGKSRWGVDRLVTVRNMRSNLSVFASCWGRCLSLSLSQANS